MRLADYLESKAEYIFYNYPVDFYGGGEYRVVETQELENNRGVIIERLKRGLIKLAQIHDDEFFGDYLGARYRQTLFTGWVTVRWGEKPNINEYFLSLSFRNWSFTKIMLEKANKEFKSLFAIRAEVSPIELKGEEFSEFDAIGEFTGPYDLESAAIALFLSHPRISKFSKNNIFSNFEGMFLRGLFLIYTGGLPEWAGKTGIFGDFHLISLNEYNTQKRLVNKNLILSERPQGNGVDVIKLKDEEYGDIVKAIEHLKEEKQIPDTNILLRDVLLKYGYMKIKGNIP